MKYLVQKFGGSSVATPERLLHVAGRIATALEECDGIVVVVSAMGDTTDRLLALAHEITLDPTAREMDMLLSAGETITAPLLTMALHARGIAAIALSGLQAGIKTSASHRNARITDITPERIVKELTGGKVVVVAGFQGVTNGDDITTLGRGGSDTSAVALAVAIGASRCDIYTDVQGVYTADPRLVAAARPLPRIGYEEMLELAAVGARVLHPRAVEIAEAYGMQIWVGSSFDDSLGTLIGPVLPQEAANMEDRQRVRGIAHETNVAKVTLMRVPDRAGVAADIFAAFAAAGINVGLIVQNISHEGLTDVSFTIAETDLAAAAAVVAKLAPEINAAGFETAADIATVSVVGAGIRGAPGVFATAFKALSAAAINIEMISTSEIHLTCVIRREQVTDAVRALHLVFMAELAGQVDKTDRTTA